MYKYDAISVGFYFSAHSLSVVPSNEQLFVLIATDQTQTLTSAGSLCIIMMATFWGWSSLEEDKTCSSKFFHVKGTKGKQIRKMTQEKLFDSIYTKGEYVGVETPKDKLWASHLIYTCFCNQGQMKLTNTWTWFSFNPVSGP